MHAYKHQFCSKLVVRNGLNFFPEIKNPITHKWLVTITYLFQCEYINFMVICTSRVLVALILFLALTALQTKTCRELT
jgi:hypothetical protein